METTMREKPVTSWCMGHAQSIEPHQLGKEVVILRNIKSDVYG